MRGCVRVRVCVCARAPARSLTSVPAESVSSNVTRFLVGVLTQLDEDRYDQAIALERIREAVGEGGVAGSFVYSFQDVDLSRFQGILPAVHTTLIAALGSAAAICAIFLINPVVTLLVTVMLVSVDVWLLGMMGFWGIALNEVSLVNLVMAVGFAVDYCSHVGHSFMTATGTRRERAEEAIVDSGRAIINAGLTSLIATAVLASGSPIFVVFAQMFLGIVGFGLLHAVVVLPVFLSILPGTSLSTHDYRPDTRATSIEEQGRWRAVKAMFFTLSGVGVAALAFTTNWITWTWTAYDRSLGALVTG